MTLLSGNLAIKGKHHLLPLVFRVRQGRTTVDAGEEAAADVGPSDGSWRDFWDLKPSPTQLALVGLGAAAVVGGFWACAAASTVKVSSVGLALLPAFQGDLDEDRGDNPVPGLQSETQDAEE